MKENSPEFYLEESKKYVYQDVSLSLEMAYKAYHQYLSERKPEYKIDEIKILNHIGLCYINLCNYPQALEVLTKSQKLADSVGNNLLKAYSILYQSRIYRITGNYDKADAFLQLLSEINITKEDTLLLILSFIEYGKNGLEKGYFVDASNNFVKAFQLLNLKNDDAAAIPLYLGIFDLFKTVKSRNDYTSYLSMAASLAGKTHQIYYQAYCIGYFDESIRTKEKFDSVQQKFNRSLQLHTINHNLHGIASLYLNFGEYNQIIGNCDLALNSYKKAYTYSMEIDFKNGIAQSLFKTGTLFLQMGLTDSAYHYLWKAKAYAEEGKNRFLLNHIFKYISQEFIVQNNYEEGYVYLKRYNEWNDEIFSSENVKKLVENEIILNNLKIAKEIESITTLKNENTRTIAKQKAITVIIVVVAFCLVALLIYYIIKYIRLKSNPSN